MPLHTLLADTTESQGGSTLLLQLLNLFEVCVSADTLARFIQFKVSKFKSDKLKQLRPDGFAVVSVDNIDFLHSYACVFCGHQKCSWHGTSVEAVQPMPSLSMTIPNQSVCTLNSTQTQDITSLHGSHEPQTQAPHGPETQASHGPPTQACQTQGITFLHGSHEQTQARPVHRGVGRGSNEPPFLLGI